MHRSSQDPVRAVNELAGGKLMSRAVGRVEVEHKAGAPGPFF